METFVLLGDAGTEVMGRQAQDLIDYYLEEKKALKKGSLEAVENISREKKALKKGSSEAVENISRVFPFPRDLSCEVMGKIKNRISPSEMTMNIEEEAKAMDIQIHSANTSTIYLSTIPKHMEKEKNKENGGQLHYDIDHSPESSNLGQDAGLLTRKPVTRGSSSTVISNGCGAYTSYSSSKAMQFRKLSGCYECHMIVDPSRYPVSPRICACPQCGEIFPKLETLEHHQAVRHAVSELGPEDSGRNIVDIIFKSSWLRKDSPIYNIERILKVHNTQRTIQRFEDCRDAVKSQAHASTRKEPRSAADGNELLRFQCTTVSCSLGSRGSTSLCSNFPGCRVCTIIRHGFHAKTLRLGGGANEIKGVRTTASSGRAHDASRCFDQRRAMLVCRVIAGRVRRVQSDAQEDENGSGSYDSVAGPAGVYTNLDDLVVFYPKAILPCFVVIYKVSEP
ncbi:hypothetical protein F2Q68_00038795 [Brassica cretica]|uniref:C2H2-type domain-containing protein n=1 Tax=Brassica cretica TaxID=69181 RepID=A0A8S9MCV8_BRACR|nr:hypothetical protein F2Q68_00038795 [Brassica cretica]